MKARDIQFTALTDECLSSIIPVTTNYANEQVSIESNMIDDYTISTLNTETISYSAQEEAEDVETKLKELLKAKDIRSMKACLQEVSNEALAYNPFLKMYLVCYELYANHFFINEQNSLVLQVSKKEIISKLKNYLNESVMEYNINSDIHTLLRKVYMSITKYLNDIKANHTALQNDHKFNKDIVKTTIEYDGTNDITSLYIKDQDSLGGPSIQSKDKYSYLKAKDYKKIASILSSKDYTYAKAKTFLDKINYSGIKQASALRELNILNRIKEDITHRAKERRPEIQINLNLTDIEF